MEKKVHIRKFVDSDRKIESIANTNTYKISDKINKGVKLTPYDKSFINCKVQDSPYIIEGGFEFDFSDVINRYVVIQGDSVRIMHGFDKRSTLKITYSQEGEIYKIPNKK